MALDTQVKGNADNISTINTTLSELGTNYSKTDLSNLNDTGKAAVRELSKSAVKVVNGTNTTVTTGTEGNATTYAVNVDTDSITNTVKAGMQTELNSKANVDASNIDAGQWATKLGTGKIATSDTGLVTGGTVYTEVRPTSDGTYVKTTNTTAANLTALDKQVKGNADTLESHTTSIQKNTKNISDLNTNITQLQDSDNLNVKYTDATKAQVDLVAANLTTTGSGSFSSVIVSGNTYISSTGINANNKVISGVLAGSADTDAVNVKQMNDAIANISSTGFSGNMNGKKITNLANGTDATDAVNKGQMDTADKATLTSAQSYTDTAKADAIKQANGYTDTAKADAIKQANGYTDTAKADAIKQANGYTDTAKADTIKQANGYTDTAKADAIKQANGYTDTARADAIKQSRDYTDTTVSGVKESIKTLTDANNINVKYDDSSKSNINLNKATITNLGSGTIAENSNDAVNGGDVYEYIRKNVTSGVKVDDKGNSVINNNLTVNGDTNLQNTTVNKKLIVNGDTNLQDTTVNKQLTVKGDTDLQNTTVNKTLTVNGDTNLQNTTVNKKLTVNGDTELQNTTVKQKLTVNGDTDLQNTTVNQKLTVNGDTDLQNTTVNKKLTVNGDTDLQNTTVNKNLTVSGDTNLQNTTVNKNLTVNGYTTLGQTTINKQLAVQGNTYISQNLAVGGNATVAQNLVVGNTIAAKQVVADDAIIGGHSVIDEFNRQREDTDRVGAGAAALAALQYLPYEDGSKLVGGAGYGHYRGKNAGAVGLRYYPNRDVAFSMASTVGNGDTMLNAGVSFRIGSGTGSVHSIPDTNKVLKETQALNKALAERLDKVEKELKQSNDTNEELMKRLAALEAKMK